MPQSEFTLLLDIVLKIVTILSIVGGVGVIVWKTSSMTTRFEMIGAEHGKAISEIKTEIKTMNALLTQVAVQKERLDNQATRLNLLDARYEELRHGEGYVFPLTSHLGKP